MNELRVRLLTQEQTETPHHFTEMSENRKARDRALAIIAHHPNLGPTYFLGERNDGMWIVFTDALRADLFRAVWEGE